MEISPEQKKFILGLARKSVRHHFASGNPLELKPAPMEPLLLEKAGAFVTLHFMGELRGCIGMIVSDEPLYVTVCKMACQAAFQDSRFPPLKELELEDVEFEVSIMSPITPLVDTSEIEIGRTGLIVRKGNNQGLLLPQVATEWKWDKEEFLCETCYKAGLPKNAWKDSDTKIFQFTATVFDESQFT